MARTTLEKWAGRWTLVAACVPLVLLTGCPQSQSGSPGKVPAQATAPAIAAASPQAAVSTAQSVDDAAKAYKAQQLINDAEKAYRSGVDNYRAGTTGCGADGLRLRGGYDADERHGPEGRRSTSDEFTHLLDAVNSLEMSALKQGNGFSPTLEAAPLDAANEVTFPPNEALTAKVVAELKTTKSDFPLVVNDYVAGFISYFSNSPEGPCSSAAFVGARGQV